MDADARAAEEVAARFEALVATPDPPLDEVALLVAARGRPDLDVDAERGRLDELAAGVHPTDLVGLRAHLFERLGFVGDRTSYHDPRNSLLDAVLDRRTGIPITLSVLLVEVGRRVGIPLVGVGMPGHFLVRSVADADADVFVDGYDGGALLDAAACRAVFERLHPRTAWEDRFLDPVSSVAIAQRMLNNLTGAYQRLRDRRSLAWVLDLRTRLPGAGERERREHALVLASLGRYREAAERFEGIEGDDAARTAARLRARLN